jgi:hypothetical protein
MAGAGGDGSVEQGSVDDAAMADVGGDGSIQSVPAGSASMKEKGKGARPGQAGAKWRKEGTEDGPCEWKRESGLCGKNWCAQGDFGPIQGKWFGFIYYFILIYDFKYSLNWIQIEFQSP